MSEHQQSRSAETSMNLYSFIDFLNCLYIREVELATRENNQERLAVIMVNQGEFGEELTQAEMTESTKRQQQRLAWGKTKNIAEMSMKDGQNLFVFVVDAMTVCRTARAVKILGKGVVKVVHRCDAAKESQALGE